MRLSFLVLLAAALPAQGMPLVVDRPVADGPVWVLAAGYKARLDPSGIRLRPDLAGAPAAECAVASLVVDGVVQDVAAGPLVWQDQDGVIAVRRSGAVREHFEFLPQGVRWWLQPTGALPRGELRLRLRGPAALLSDGLAAQVSDGGGRLGAAVGWAAVDAFELVLGGDLLQRATGPLRIVVELTGPAPAPRRTADPAPDLAYDQGLGLWLQVWQRTFAGDDIDVLARWLDAELRPLDQVLAIDVSDESWRRPRVAGHVLTGSFLCVAEAVSSGPPRIAARRVDGRTGARGAPFDVSAAWPGAATRPVLGGSPSFEPTARFTVLWQHEPPGGPIRVVLRQVDGLGSLLPGPVFLSPTGEVALEPAISRSCGVGDAADQRWFVVWRRPDAAGGTLLGCQLAWDGAVAQGPAPLAVGGFDPGSVAVGSATRNEGQGRRGLLAWTAGGGVWLGALQPDGSLTGRTDLRGVVGAAAAPAVDGDGCRFAVVVVRAAAGARSEVEAVTVAMLDDGTRLRIDDRRQLPAGGVAVAGSPAIAAEHSSAGTHGWRYGVAAPGGGDWSRCAVSAYDGRSPGPLFAFRPTACGPLAEFEASGVPAPGGALWFAFPTSAPSGYLVGLPADQPLGFCPCRLGVTAFVVVTNPYVTHIPCTTHLVGATFAAQGFHFAGSSCLQAIDLTATLDLTLR